MRLREGEGYDHIQLCKTHVGTRRPYFSKWTHLYSAMSPTGVEVPCALT